LTYGVKSVIERASTQDVKGGGRIVTAACEIIRLHASEGIGVADVATRLNVSRRLLEIRFHEVLGKGVAEELRRVRLENVCRQLRRTQLSIREISAKSGFASSAHLNALFLATYDMTMRDWRKSANSPISQKQS
jgi:AraC-like DNA-binding protein